jgi:hypothetical protein
MKKFISCSALVAVLALMSGQLFSQSAGTNPSLVMYRYNNFPTQPSPALNGDLLGTLKWDGLTAIGVDGKQSGATIQSYITGPVSFGVIPANMIFSTRNAAGLNRQMIITSNGLVGIGEMNPAFNLDVLGNTHTSGRFHGRIHFDNLSPANDAPNTYTDEAYFERKLRSTLGVPAAAGINDFGGILSLAPGGGAYDHQLFFGQDGIWNRRDAGAAAAWGAAWEKLLSSADIMGRPNLVARFRPPGPISNSLGDSQLYDDGANVVIGGIPAAPAPATPVFNPANLLTVNGATRINGNTNITNDLDVDLNANIDGSLQVDGNGRVDGRLVVGNPPATPGGHMLYVNGSMIAEEVKVKLQPSWPDYVFETGYELKPLVEVEQYILENKHLPGIASANDVAENGLDLGLTQKAQMEKIEELYLYMIEANKQMQALRAENDQLKARIEKLEQR